MPSSTKFVVDSVDGMMLSCEYSAPDGTSKELQRWIIVYSIPNEPNWIEIHCNDFNRAVDLYNTLKLARDCIDYIEECTP